MSASRRVTARDRYQQRPQPQPTHLVTLARAYVSREDQGATPQLQITFIGEAAQTLDISFLLSTPQLTLPFAQALCEWGSSGVSSSYRNGVIRNLYRGFFEFLALSELSSINFAALDTRLMERYLKWLDCAKKKDGKLFAISSRQMLYSSFTVVFKQMQRLVSFKNILSKVYVPREPWRARDRLQTPTRSMTRDEWERLFVACMTETTATMSRLEEGWKSMQISDTATSPPKRGREEYRELSTCLADLAHFYPDVLPPWQMIRDKHFRLSNAINSWHGIREVNEYFQPNAEAMIPFLLLLAMWTGYNGASLTELRWSQVNHESVLGVERMILSPFKARSGSEQTWSFLPEDVPSRLLPFLERWTARLRSASTNDPQDFVFQYLTVGRRTVSWFKGHNFVFHSAIQKFVARHNLPHVTLRIIRQSFLDIIREESGNNPQAVQRAAGHRSIDLQQTHYTSDAARQRNDERLGHLENLMGRWVGTNGRMDPRGLTAERQDWGAATPGFVCLDPLDSPQPREIKGRLCTAYAACITCPLAVVNTQSPHALVRLLQLRQRIQEAQLDLDADAWLSAWGPRYSKLNEVWLPAFSEPSVLAAAEQVRLPDLPAILVME